MSLKISISGVRGFVPASLTPEVCLNFAKAFGTYLGGGKIVIGTDSRKSSEFIKGIIFSGLLSTGCKVVDLGICPTPTVGIMTKHLNADGGIIITASHNPLPWNGIKFLRGDGIFLNEEQAKKLINIYESKEFVEKDALGVTANSSAIDFHIARVIKTLKPKGIKKKKFKVVVDGCNSAGSVALPKLLAKLGCKVISLHCNTRLPFPHDPEPIAKNLSDLMRTVKEEKADIGFAVDSDADRLAVISEKGEAVGEETTLALAVKHMLSKSTSLSSKNKIIVVNLSTSRMIDDICREFHAKLIRTKVGEVHVAEELKKLKALIGGEGNGGVIFPKVGFNRDSLTGAAILLEYLASSGKKLSELIADLPHYAMVKTKIECRSTEEANDYVDKVKSLFKGEDLVLTEGVKVITPDGWIHIRPSNTEPIIRIIAEGKNLDAAEELVRRAS